MCESLTCVSNYTFGSCIDTHTYICNTHTYKHAESHFSYVCMYIHTNRHRCAYSIGIYICVHTYIHINMRTHPYIYIEMQALTHIHGYTNRYLHIHTCITHACIYTYTHTNRYLHIHTCIIHECIYTYTYTYVQIRTYIQKCKHSHMHTWI